MRALRVVSPNTVEIQEVPDLSPGVGEILLDVERVGICGTDVELFTGEMAYFQSGRTTFPVQLGHEWTGIVSAVGVGVSSEWIGKRVTGDTMLGCGLWRLDQLDRGRGSDRGDGVVGAARRRGQPLGSHQPRHQPDRTFGRALAG